MDLKPLHEDCPTILANHTIFSIPLCDIEYGGDVMGPILCQTNAMVRICDGTFEH